MTQTILVIDDEQSIQRLLKTSLESNGYAVQSAHLGEEGMKIASSNSEISAVLLDLGLPDMSGIELLTKMRTAGIKIPIIVLTVLEDDANKVAALDLGADDYVTKPFSIPELLARIRVAIRHSGRSQTEAKVIKAGSLEIDIPAHQVRVRDQEIKLTPLEFQILALLGKNLGKVVTHRVLLNKIWGPNSLEHVQYLRVHLGQIRKKLKEFHVEDLLVTESGVGYRLLGK
jgi:two-component system KDP operon response regulator KdpE